MSAVTPGRVAVAMSGGVDSTVAAALLAEAGHEVIGVTLKLQDCHEARGSRSCCGIDGIARARAAAGHLGIRHYVVDYVGEFEDLILRPAWNEYDAGRTPSPCLLCNERIKFGLLLDWARELGATALATGHYARIETDGAGEPRLLRGLARDKDQSYFLAGLTAQQLKSIMFPLGCLEKPEVRERARQVGFANADAQDSQDACLVGAGQSFAEMLRERFHASPRPGLVVDETGRKLGTHPGIHNFTVGQRRGLGIQSLSRSWVKTLQGAVATVVVTSSSQGLMADRLVAGGVNWLVRGELPETLRCQAQIRYRHLAEDAEVTNVGAGQVRVVFARPVRAITPGQAVVFYDGARVLGRGWIDGVG